MTQTRSARRLGRHRVFDYVRSQIIGLEFAPGTAISENELAATLGVSRTPVRDALLLLAEEGLVEVFPKVGTFVSRVDPDRVAEAQFLREAVELASLHSLRVPLDEEILAGLRENLDRQVEAEDDLTAFFELDEAFHRGLMSLAGHEASWSTVSAAKGHLDRARMLGIRQVPFLSRFVTQHREILDAAAEGDVAAAGEHLRSHLRVVFTDVRQAERERPELFVRDRDALPVRRSAFVWE